MRTPSNSSNSRQRLWKHFKATAPASHQGVSHNATQKLCVLENSEAIEWSMICVSNSHAQAGSCSVLAVCILLCAVLQTWTLPGVSTHKPTQPPNQPAPPLTHLPLKPVQAIIPSLFYQSGRSPARRHDWQIGTGTGRIETKNSSLNPSSSLVLFQFTHLFLPSQYPLHHTHTHSQLMLEDKQIVL